ncbi:hypothetical protein C8J57DRAFT_1230588 [Mycena rebaudengoi]|nr:hypothetical protein C8J57DRAFT_1230588 [Mycena rebaudengoi]
MPLSKLGRKERRERTRFPDPRYPINLQSADEAFIQDLGRIALHVLMPPGESTKEARAQKTTASATKKHKVDGLMRIAFLVMLCTCMCSFALRVAHALSYVRVILLHLRGDLVEQSARSAHQTPPVPRDLFLFFISRMQRARELEIPSVDHTGGISAGMTVDAETDLDSVRMRREDGGVRENNVDDILGTHK